MSKQVMQMALPLLIAYQDYTNDSRIANRCGEVIKTLEAELAKPEQKQECETCAAKRKRLTDAGLLKSPLRQALAKPEQEPVAYLYHDASCAELANPLVHSTVLVLACDRKPSYRNETPLYTSPPRK